jgi:hypothetical protein
MTQSNVKMQVKETEYRLRFKLKMVDTQVEWMLILCRLLTRTVRFSLKEWSKDGCPMVVHPLPRKRMKV